MQKNVRAGLGAAVALASVVALGGTAVADGHGAYPSQQQVDKAKATVAAKQGDVAAIRAQYAQVQRQASAADLRAEIASEAYNGAMWKLSVARTAARKAEAAATAAQQRVAAQRASIAALVVQSYQEGTSLNTLTAFLGADGPEEIMGRTSVVNMAGSSLRADYDRYTQLSDAAASARTAAEQAASKQQVIANQAQAARVSATAAAQQAQALVGQVSKRRAALVTALAAAEHTSVALASARQAALDRIARERAAAAARRAAIAAAARARAAAAAAASQQGSPGAGSVAPSVPQPSSGGAAAAIAFAKAQIGKPYVWAGAGPNVWDCSGLTMMAWRQGGISMPHYAASQYNYGTPIPVTDARPGDLLFWSYNGQPSGIHHVALSLGGGEFIEAPHTGALVRYNSIYNEYPDFAVRM